MDRLTILVNTIVLLLKEKNDKNIERAKKILEILEESNIKTYSGDSDIYGKLMNILDKIIVDDIEENNAVYENIKLILSNRQDILKSIENIRKIEDGKELQSSLKYLKRTIDDFIKRSEIIKILQVNLYKIKTESTIDEIDRNLQEMIDRFLKLITLNRRTDDAMVEEIDLESDDDIILNVIKRIKDRRKDEHVFKTGWSCLNETTQGGLRKGEFVTIAGLQHNYKSGFTFSLFTQIVTLNKPAIRFENKKPLAILFSLEDENENVFEFIYRYLKITNESEVVDINNVSEEEMKDYIKKELTKNGFSVKILRMDPNYITPRKLKDKIESYKLSGYDVQVVFVDYLSQIQKDGLAQGGPTGSDLKNLFKMFRNYANREKILFVTPHQISTDAKRLLSNGLPPLEFVKFIANKGFYDGSKRLDQEIDLELYIHIAKKDKKPVLTVQRGKHRIPTTIPDEKKFFMLEFIYPNKAPIPGESEDHKPCMRDEDLDSMELEF